MRGEIGGKAEAVRGVGGRNGEGSTLGWLPVMEKT